MARRGYDGSEMATLPPLNDRLRNGLARIAAEAAGMFDSEALTMLRRSLELTLARLESGGLPGRFRFQFTGGKPIRAGNQFGVGMKK